MYCHVLPVLPSLVKPILPSKQRKEVAFGWTNNYRPKVQTCFAIDDFYCCKIANTEDKIILEHEHRFAPMFGKNQTFTYHC